MKANRTLLYGKNLQVCFSESKLRGLLVGLLIIFVVLSTSAQQRVQQPVQQSGPLTQNQMPKKERDWKPSMLRFNYDLIPVGAGIFGADRRGQGFQAAIDFDQYFFAVEFGTQKSERGDTYSYENKGNYFSFGPEVNLMSNDKKGNSLTFGLRYGHANFSDKLSFSMDNTFFGTFDVQDANPNLKANWMELTLGLNANVWKGMYLGYTIRYKVLRQVKGIGDMAPYDVPGFGLYENNTGIQFNFYVGWAIKFREKYPQAQIDDL